MAYLDETGLARFWYDIKQWIASAASNLVHRTGHEDISGRKVFNTTQYYDPETQHNILVSRPMLRTLDFARSDPAPSSNQFISFDMVDNTYDADTPYEGATRLGMLEYVYRTDGARDMKIGVLNPQNEGVVVAVGFDASDIAYAVAPSTSDQRNNGTDIVTRNWIPNDTRIVHSTGNEQISGEKSFESSVNIRHSTAKGTDPSGSTSYRQLNFSDSTGTNVTGARASCVEGVVYTSGQTSIYMRAYNWVVGSSANAAVAVHYPKNGTAYTEAPTPSDVADNSTKIATTAWAFPKLARFYASADSALLDLDDYVTPGVYTFDGVVNDSGSYVVANIPEGVNGTLLVIGNSSYIVRQVWFRLGTNDSTDHRIFVRQRNWLESNSWSAWTRLFTSKDTIPVANGGTGSTTKNFVDLTTNQNVGGNKTYTSEVKILKGSGTFIRFNDSDLVKGTPPQQQKNFYIPFDDNSGGRFFALEGIVRNSGETVFRAYAFKNVAGSSDSTSISLVYPASGDPYATAPTPSSVSDDSDKIATTEWVRDATGDFACNAATATKATQDGSGNVIASTYLPLSGGTMTG